MLFSDKNRRFFNLAYAAAQGIYWMGFCICVAFAAVYMQYRGYSNTALGAVVALGNIAGFLLAPAVAALVDSSRRITIFHCLWATAAVQLMLFAVLMTVPGRSFATAAAYCLYIACCNLTGPLINQLSLNLEERCCHINFGAARSVGSFAFAVTALALGRIVESRSAAILPAAGIVCTLALSAAAALIYARMSGAAKPVQPQQRKEHAAGLYGFIRGNGRFCIVMLGMSLIFFSHNIVSGFMINVVRAVGGGTAVMGGINAFMALTELPCMILYDRIEKRFGCAATVRFAAVMFVAKSLCIALAGNIPALYAANAIQAVSYAIMIPAGVRYAERYTPHKDSAKAQSIAFGMSTLGSVFSGSIGGVLYDALPVHSVLLVGTAAAAVGAAVCLIFSRSAAKP